MLLSPHTTGLSTGQPAGPGRRLFRVETVCALALPFKLTVTAAAAAEVRVRLECQPPPRLGPGTRIVKSRRRPPGAVCGATLTERKVI
jgi:hypothetical protein